MKKQFTKEQFEFINLLKTTDQPQGKNALCTEEGFCCLGLGMSHFRDRLNIKFDLIMPKHKNSHLVKHVTVRYVTENEQEVAIALSCFVDLLKLHDKQGSSLKQQQLSLVSLNDEGMSFKEIGEILESNPEQYFTNFTEENNND